jgi:uncharacterized protein (TIGR02231 family)
MRLRVAAALAVLPSLALAADLDLTSRIDRVTVFPDAAVVTRVAPVELYAGASTLVLRGLPTTIDPASIRVEGEGSAAFAIGGVDTRLVPGEAKPVIDAELERRIRALRDEREGLAGRVAAAEGKKATIQRYAQASPEKLSPEAKPLDPAQWATAWEAIGSALAAVNEELRQLQSRARDLEGEIATLERARPPAPRPGAPKRDIVVAVEASTALKGQLRVTYRVAGAGWQPLYDARLDTGDAARKPSLELVRRAQITQRTGEDWSDVALSVSTVRVSRGSTAPDLHPLVVQLYEPPPPRPLPRPAPPAARRERAEEAPVPYAVPTPEPYQAPVAAAPVLAQDVVSTVESGAFQATFAVPGRVSVGQDGATKSVVLARRSLNPSLLVKTAPAVDETAYLEASFTNEDDAPLLPGEVAVHRDGTFVGRARIRLTGPGDAVELGFGADDRVKVARVPVRKRESESGFIGQTKNDLREFKTTVKSLHAQAIRIVVLDRIPVSENANVVVEQLRETTPPTEKQVADKRGVSAWAYDYAPGETREIRLAYRIRWPAERDLTYGERPNGKPAS